MGAAQAIPAMLAQQMVKRLAGGPASGQPPGGPQGPPGAGMGGPGASEMAGQQVAAQLGELQGADPDMIMKMLNQVKSVMVALYPRSAFTLPGVARALAQAQKYVDQAIKEAEQGAATAQAVQNPIANQAGQPQGLRGQPGRGPGGPGGPVGLEQFAQQGAM